MLSLRVVEAEDDQDDDRREQERVDEHGVRAQQRVPFARHRDTGLIPRSPRAAASQRDQRPDQRHEHQHEPERGAVRPVAALEEQLLDDLRDRRRLGPPRMSGVTKSPIAGMNVSSAAAIMPGIVSGSVTWRNAERPLAYRSRAAATRFTSSRSIDTYSGRIANGRKPYVMPRITDRSVLSRMIGSVVSPTADRIG